MTKGLLDALRLGVLPVFLWLSTLPSAAQVTPGGTPPGTVGRPAPVQSAPLAPPAAQPSAAGRPTLVPGSGDPSNADEVVLPGKPAAVSAGTSTWDDGFTNLKAAFRKIEDELARAALTPSGRPLTVFVETDDLGFRYEAMVPIAQAPAGRPTLTPEIRFGRTPDGKALRFVHRGAYEEVDDTYETITAYLDAKGIIVKDMFIEEYLADLTEAADPNLEINVFVQPK